MKYPTKRKPIFVILFICLVALAGLGQVTDYADASSGLNTNATIPPPGGTLPPNASGIQLLHLAPFNTNNEVDIVINGSNVSVLYTDIGLGQSTGAYLAVAPGSVTASVTPQIGGGSFAYAETLVTNTEYTAAIIGGTNGWPVEFMTLKDTTTDSPPLMGKVRIVHAAPFAAAPAINTAVNVLDDSGESIDIRFEGLLYAESTPYIELPIGFYDWQVSLPGGSTVVDLPIFTLYSEAVVTLYIVGDGTDAVQPNAGLLVIHEIGNEPTFLFMPAIAYP